MGALGTAMTKGAAWMVFLKLTERGIGLLSMLLLARLLVPADFGLVALATSVLAVLELLGSFSFDIALIQNQNAQRSHYDTVWTFAVLFGLFCAIVLVAIAEPLGAFYGEPRLPAILYFLALAAFIQGFENVGIIAFRKELQFDKEFRFVLLRRLAVAVATLSLAFVWKSYWALIGGILTGKCFGVALSYILQGYRPRFSLAERHELFNFSKWLLANNLLYFINNRAGDFVIGKIAGFNALGLYNMARDMSTIATLELIAPINRAVFSGYAKMAERIDVLRDGFMNVISLVSLVVVPAGVGLAAVADTLVPVLLGPGWNEAIPLMKVLALYGVLMALQTNSWYVYLAMGKPYAITAQVLAYDVVLLPLLVWLSMEHGSRGAAYAYLVSLCIVSPGVFVFLFRNLKLGMGDFARALCRPVLGSLVMYPSVVLVSETLPVHPVLKLGAAIASGAVIYAVVVLAVWHMQGRPAGAESQVLALLRVRLAAYRKKGV